MIVKSVLSGRRRRERNIKFQVYKSGVVLMVTFQPVSVISLIYCIGYNKGSLISMVNGPLRTYRLLLTEITFDMIQQFGSKLAIL